MHNSFILHTVLLQLYVKSWQLIRCGCCRREQWWGWRWRRRRRWREWWRLDGRLGGGERRQRWSEHVRRRTRLPHITPRRRRTCITHTHTLTWWAYLYQPPSFIAHSLVSGRSSERDGHVTSALINQTNDETSAASTCCANLVRDSVWFLAAFPNKNNQPDFFYHSFGKWRLITSIPCEIWKCKIIAWLLLLQEETHLFTWNFKKSL